LSGVRCEGKARGRLTARGNLELRADVNRDLGGVEVDEMADFVVGDAAQLRPLAQGPNRRLLTGGKNTAGPKTDDVDELTGDGGIFCRLVHIGGNASTGHTGRGIPSNAPETEGMEALEHIKRQPRPPHRQQKPAGLAGLSA